MNNEPYYLAQKKRIYSTYQVYRRLRDALTKLEQHQYPDDEPFITLFAELTEALRNDDIKLSKFTVDRLDQEWLRRKYKL